MIIIIWVVLYILWSTISSTYYLRHANNPSSLFYEKYGYRHFVMVTMLFWIFILIAVIADAIHLYWDISITIRNPFKSKKVSDPDPLKIWEYYWWDIVIYQQEYAMIVWYIAWTYYVLPYWTVKLQSATEKEISIIKRPESEMKEELQLYAKAQELKDESEKFQKQSKDLLEKAKDIQSQAIKLKKNNLFLSR